MFIRLKCNCFWFQKNYKTSTLFFVLMNLILGLAPMDWFTDNAFRLIAQRVFDMYWEKDKVDFQLRTEFMNADGYCINPAWVLHHLVTSPEQKKCILQLFGWDIQTLKKATVDVCKKYGDLFVGIELNLGCPAKNVMRCGWGARMLKNKQETVEIIKSLAELSTLPFSIKTRIWLTDNDLDAQKNMLIEASKYCHIISIHGRTVQQWYAWEAQRDFAYDLKKTFIEKWITTKVIGNGSIKTYADCWERLKNLDWVMVGQAAIGNPWIFTPHQPTMLEKKQCVLEHLDLMIANELYLKRMSEKLNFKKDIVPMPDLETLKKEILPIKSWTQSFTIEDGRWLTEFRKHLFSYVKWIEQSKEFKVATNAIKDYQALVAHIEKFFNES